jgi:hypothetical protein
VPGTLAGLIRVAPLALVLLLAACGTARGPVRAPAHAPPPSPWPNAADYQTIKMARAVRDDALFHEPNWRVKSYAASLVARTLLTVRVAAGSCATYVTELYGNLRDLMDAYAGEDWRPLIRLVRREPALSVACRGASEHVNNATDAFERFHLEL